MISKADKVRLLNVLLAGTSPHSSELYACATEGMKNALRDYPEISLADFARRAVALYNPAAKLEFLDFTGGYFDPLFALPHITAAIKRLSGYPAAVLVIDGLSEVPAGRRRTRKALADKMRDFEFVEDTVMGYKKTFPQLEVFFI